VSVSRIARAFAFVALLPVAISSLSGAPFEPDDRKVDPLLVATDIPAVTAIQRKIAGSPVRTQTPVPLYFRLESEDPAFPDRVRGLGGVARKVSPFLYTGRMPRDAVRYLSNRPEVIYLEAARNAYPLLDVSAPAVHADIVHAGMKRWPPPFNGGIGGGNVYVGVVDTGLDEAHLDFHTGENGSPSRVVHTYASSQLPLLNPPLSPDPLVDEDGHGTHVTGIAAGNGFSSSGTYTGMAPQSPILFGKTSFLTTDISEAVADLLASAEPSPVTINLSLGLAVGPHDGSSGFESSIESLATGLPGSRRLVVVAAGNERTDEEHFRATLPTFGVVTAFLSLESTTGTIVEFWADGEDQYTVLATTGGESITVSSGKSGASGTGHISVSNRRTVPPNGGTLITVTFLAQNVGQDASIRLARIRNGGTGAVDGYVDQRDGIFGTPTQSGTVTEPANARNVITVGSFDTKKFPGGTPDQVQDISSFSSLGPTRDGRIKPDLGAPGSVIYSARSRDAFFRPDLIAPNDNYVILQGTSMAAPHVTGIAALVWESNPALSGAQMRERLRRTADPVPINGVTPNTTWGSGRVNALRAVTESVASITAPAAALPGSIVSLTSETSSAAFNNPLDGYSWTLTPPSGSGASLAGTSFPSTSFSPDIPGDYRVDLAVSQSSPASTPPGSAAAVIHVNTLPDASITGPSFSDNTDPVAFQGVATDPDPGQTKRFRWVLVSRPVGSGAVALATSGTDTAILSPDTAGAYVVGLRVDDGLDNSSLVTKSYSAGSAASRTGTGGSGVWGGCSLLRSDTSPPAPSVFGPAILLLPLVILAVRRSADRRNRPRKR